MEGNDASSLVPIGGSTTISLDSVRVTSDEELEIADDSGRKASTESLCIKEPLSPQYVPLAELLSKHQFRELQRVHPTCDWSLHYVSLGNSAWDVIDLKHKVRELMKNVLVMHHQIGLKIVLLMVSLRRFVADIYV